MKSNILNVMLLMPFRNIIIISMSEFSMLKNLEQLQADGCQTHIFLVGATSKVSIHRAMLFAGHVKPDLVWYQLDPGEEDGKVIVIVPDASTEELKSFVRKLYSPLLSGPSRRQNLMVADEMFPDRPGAGIHFADIEDVVRDVGGPANLLNDLTTSDCPGEDIFYTAVPNTHSVSLSSMMQVIIQYPSQQPYFYLDCDVIHIPQLMKYVDIILFIDLFASVKFGPDSSRSDLVQIQK